MNSITMTRVQDGTGTEQNIKCDRMMLTDKWRHTGVNTRSQKSTSRPYHDICVKDVSPGTREGGENYWQQLDGHVMRH